MKIENNNVISAQNFTALKINKTFNANIAEQILDAPTVKAFGKKYDATLGMQLFQSSNPKKVSKDYIALTVSNIKPANLLVRIIDMFKTPVDSIALKTHALNDEMFVKSISMKSKNTLTDIYNSATKK